MVWQLNYSLGNFYMEEITYLNDYPLEEYYICSEQYLKSRIDWDEISKKTTKNGVSYFAISDVVQLFSHLELDENYELICYLGREYHGIWGRIAAIKHGDNLAPVFDAKTESISFLFKGKDFKLPECAVPPMEAIYHDGTDEGYFEAVLCSLLLDAIPYLHFHNRNLKIIMDNPPPDFHMRWNTVVNIETWTPRRVNRSIIAFKRCIEDGVESSDGKDRIYLTQFVFERNLGFYHAFATKKHSMYRSQIDDDKRYNKNRCCCVFKESSVFVAEEM